MALTHALLSFNVLEDGVKIDPRSGHLSEPVKQKGVRPTTKWVMSKWLRQRRYEVDAGAFRAAARARKEREGQMRRKVDEEIAEQARSALGT